MRRPPFRHTFILRPVRRRERKRQMVRFHDVRRERPVPGARVALTRQPHAQPDAEPRRRVRRVAAPELDVVKSLALERVASRIVAHEIGASDEFSLRSSMVHGYSGVKILTFQFTL